ncbi:MAG: hypothetical protein ACPGXK_05015 [Phycisphaerae bacterium]
MDFDIFSRAFWIPFAIVLLLWWVRQPKGISGWQISRVLALVALLVGVGFLPTDMSDQMLPWWRLYGQMVITLLLARELWSLFRNVTSQRLPDVSGIKYFLLSAFLVAFIQDVVKSPIVTHMAHRVAWEFGAYSDLPFPFVAPVEHPYGSDSLDGRIRQFTRHGFASFVAISIAHTVGFFACMFVHRIWGWPRYWKTLKPRLAFTRYWSESARNSWWVWPLFILPWECWTQLDNGFWAASYPMINTSAPVFLALLLVIFTFQFRASVRSLQRGLVSAVKHDEWLCNQCGYALRGIAGGHCPECGLVVDAAYEPEVRIGRPRSPFMQRITHVRRALFLWAALLLPLWLTPVLIQIPRTQRAALPGILSFPTVWFPPRLVFVNLRLDAVTIVYGTNGEYAVVVPEVRKDEDGNDDQVWLTVGYWESTAAETDAAPATQETIKLYDAPELAGRYPHKFGALNFNTSISRSRTYGFHFSFRIFSRTTSLRFASELKSEYTGDLSWMNQP